MMNKTVSCVIPTFDGQRLLQKHLPSILQGAREGDEIVIVDDASQDETVTWLVKTYQLRKVKSSAEFDVWEGRVSKPRALTFKVISNHQNLRFAATSNRGVQESTGELIFLLNNDVAIQADTLSHLIPHFADPQVFAVGCHEIEEKKQGISGGKNRLWFQRGMFMHSRASEYRTGETAWASGGSALFDRQKWLELGGFDLRYYPAYWEDVDLSFRARQKGWKVLFDAEAVVYHNHESTNTDVFGQQKMSAISWKNARTFTWTHATLLQKCLFLLWTPYWILKSG